MVLFDKKRNMVIKTSILTNMPNIYYKKRNKNGAYVLNLKNKSEQKYITSTDLEFLIDKCVEDYGYILETDLAKATTEDFPYVVLDEVSEDIVLCDDGKFRLYGYRDETPFVFFDGSSELLKAKLWNKNLANVKNLCTARRGVVHKGKKFVNWKDFCKHIGVSPITLGDRIRRGNTLEEAVAIKGNLPQRVNYKGTAYSSLSELARAFGIKPSSLNMRINSGMDLEEAVQAPIREQKKYLCDGKYVELKEVKKYCQKHGVNVTTISQYYLDAHGKNVDIKDLVKDFLDKKEQQVIVYHGKEYPTMTNALFELNVKESLTTIKSRMEKHGMSFEEVIDADPRMFKCGKIFRYKDKVYYSFRELSKGVNIPEDTLRKRLANGMSVEEAVEAPRNQVVKNREVITYKGKTYKMWSEFFEKNPLFKRARGSIQERRQKGMSIEEALDDYAKRNFVTDHKGNVFRNNKERSLKYGLSPATVRNRLMSGWSLEQSLSPTKQKLNSKKRIK